MRRASCNHRNHSHLCPSKHRDRCTRRPPGPASGSPGARRMCRRATRQAMASQSDGRPRRRGDRRAVRRCEACCSTTALGDDVSRSGRCVTMRLAAMATTWQRPTTPSWLAEQYLSLRLLEGWISDAFATCALNITMKQTLAFVICGIYTMYHTLGKPCQGFRIFASPT